MDKRVFLVCGLALSFLAVVAGLIRPGAIGASAPQTALVPQSESAPLPTSPPPTWTPGPPPDKTAVPPTEPQKVAGFIHLWVRCEPATGACVASLGQVWTQVESQQADGTWAPVTGWEGKLDAIAGSEGEKVWWYGTADLPSIRWSVYATQNGELLSVSDAIRPGNGTSETVLVLSSDPILLPMSGGESAGSCLAGIALIWTAIRLLRLRSLADREI